MSVGRSVLDKRLETLFLLFVLAWGAYVLVESISYEQFFAWVMPLLVSIALIATVLVELGSQYSTVLGRRLERVKLDQSLNTESVDRTPTVREIVIFCATTLVYVILAPVIGFFYAMPLFLFAYFYLYDCFDLRWSVLITIAVWVGTSFLFGTIFDVPGLDFGIFSRIDLGLF